MMCALVRIRGPRWRAGRLKCSASTRHARSDERSPAGGHGAETRMQTRVVGQLGVEGGGEDAPLVGADGDDVAGAVARLDRYAGADARDDRRADEDGSQIVDTQ